jgi:hypothetical protein
LAAFSGFDFDLVTLQTGFVGFQRDHARGCHHSASFDVEGTIVKVALDHFAIDGAL